MPSIEEIDKWPVPEVGELFYHRLYGRTKFTFVKVAKNERYYWWDFTEDTGWTRCFDPADMKPVKRPAKKGKRVKKATALKQEAEKVEQPSLEFGGKIIK